MRKTALTGLVVLSLAGCATQTGTFTDPSAATKAVVGAALEDLAQRPALEYRGSVTDIGGSGGESTVSLDVASTGTFHGEGTAGDHEFQLAHTQEVFLISAPQGYWVEYGVEESYAEKIDGKWTQVDPTAGLNPGQTLTPAAYSEVLRFAMEDAQSLAVALPDPEDRDGVEVYPVVVGEGFVYVTVAEPNTIVEIADVGVQLESGEATFSVDVAGADRTYAEGFQSRITEAAEGMTTIYDTGIDLVLAESDFDFNCNSDNFSCKLSLKVTSQLSANYHLADRVKITLKADVDGGGLGKKKCDQEKSADVGDAASMSCSVTFTPSVGEFSIQPSWTTSGVASHKPETEEWVSGLADEFTELLGGY